MATVTVSTKDELESAVKNNAEKIIITGDLAKEIAKVQKKKSVAKKVGIGSAIGAGVAVVAGIAAAPFTAGASAVAASIPVTSALAAFTATAGAGAVITTAGGTTVALSTAEFIAGILGTLGALGIAAGTINSIAKNYNVKVSAGSTTVECTRK